MFCRRARSWISLALDGLLPPDRTVALTEHLERCAACREYREELRLGHRLLAATRPQPADNFSWRLQLKLNQTLREGARAATLPWRQTERLGMRWWGAAGFAAAAGLAVILGAERFIPPAMPVLRPGVPASELTDGRTRPAVAGGEMPGTALPQTTPLVELASALPHTVEPPRDNPRVRDTADDGSRTSFSAAPASGLLTRSSAGATGRAVGLWEQRSTASGLLSREVVWSGRSLDDLRTINRLREENQRLRLALTAAQRDNSLLKAQLDSSGVPPQDH